MVEESPDDETLTVRSVLKNDGIRSVIRKPRVTPRRIREDIAEILCREIVFHEPYRIKDTESFVEKYGAFYHLLKYMRSSSEWKELIELSNKNQAISTMALEFVLDKTLGQLDELYHKNTGGEPQVDGSLSEFLDLVRETMDLWNRRVSGTRPSTNTLITPIDNNEEQGSSDRVVEDEKADEREPHISDRDAECQYDQALAYVMRDVLDDISNFVSEMEGHAEVLGLLSMLYMGRNWDYSLFEMHKEYLDNLSMYSMFLERNAELQRIIELLGRIELESGSKRQAISSQGRTEAYSVTTSKNIEYVLPMELAKLDDETMEYLFYQKFIEGKLLTYQLRGKYPVGGPPSKKRRGPVVALVDTSGSMHGAPELVAKSVILAVAKKMLREKRDVKVILFSSVNQTTDIELTNTKKMATEFLDFLNYTFGGGTDFNTALRSGLKSVKEKQYTSADILFITDGESVVSDNTLLAEWRTFKKGNDTRVFSIIVGNNNAGGLEKVSDHTFILGANGEWNGNESPGKMIELVCKNE